MTKGKKQEVKSKSEETRVNEEVELLKSQLARTLADYDNLRKRTERERAEISKIVSVNVVLKLLPVLDMIENAQKHLKDGGLAIGIGEFINVLKDEGLVVINPSVDDDFDANYMEAVEVVPGMNDNKVAEVVLAGWKFENGPVVRHAKVKVSKITN